MNSASALHQIGLHLRLQENLSQTIEQADKLQLPVFQFFLSKAENKKSIYINPTPHEKHLLEVVKARHNAQVFIHASYWINPASFREEAYAISKNLMKKEIALANALGIEEIVLHPGTANGLPPETPSSEVRARGIQRLVDFLNEVLAESSTKILLENTAHGRNAIGSDLADFKKIKNMLNQPEKVFFCLDTGHAFAYGYDVANTDHFLEEVREFMGFENLKLIHLNDIEGLRGSKQDKHTFPGEGQIGLAPLIKITSYEPFQSIPYIIELPQASIESSRSAILSVKPHSQYFQYE